jgi:hypothetical protein
MTDQKYHVLDKELRPVDKSHGHWSSTEYRANYGVFTLILTEHHKDGQPWHYWSAAILIGNTELRQTKYISVEGKCSSELMPQTPYEPLNWLRYNVREMAREMQDLANWEPG